MCQLYSGKSGAGMAATATAKISFFLSFCGYCFLNVP
jgi:hypothetical protein